MCFPIIIIFHFFLPIASNRSHGETIIISSLSVPLAFYATFILFFFLCFLDCFFYLSFPWWTLGRKGLYRVTVDSRKQKKECSKHWKADSILGSSDFCLYFFFKRDALPRTHDRLKPTICLCCLRWRCVRRDTMTPWHTGHVMPCPGGTLVSRGQAVGIQLSTDDHTKSWSEGTWGD